MRKNPFRHLFPLVSAGLIGVIFSASPARPQESAATTEPVGQEFNASADAAFEATVEALSTPAPAPTEAATTTETPEDLSIFDAELGNDPILLDEPAPRPEPPYPGSEEDGFAGAQANETVTEPPPPLVKEKPLRIDDEENYYYSTDAAISRPRPAPGLASPETVREDGTYVYEPEDESQPPRNRLGAAPPATITGRGEYLYEVEHSPLTGTASVRIGVMDIPSISNQVTGRQFSDIYDSSSPFVLLMDYEWRLTSAFGRFGLKATSGLLYANGQGQFATSTDRFGDMPEEQFTFVMFPNQITAIYRFQYAETQAVVPYAEGGAGYFTFMELRDAEDIKLGGAAAAVAAGGVSIILDWLDQKAIRQLDNDFGINHLWLTLEYRQIIGLNESFDFTSSVINAGITVDF